LSSLAEIVRPVVHQLGLRARAARSRGATALVVVGIVLTALAVWAAVGPERPPLWGGYVRVDAMSQVLLAVVNPIFLGISVYVWNRVSIAPTQVIGGARFQALSVVFMLAANVVLVANHLLVLWIALEATTLAAAPMIVRPGVRASELASWRYLLFSSIALSLVLLGFVFLSRGMSVAGLEPTHFVDQLMGISGKTSNAWTKLGLSLVLLGLGTKLGLAPMYSWLPEAYDEAPPAVTALLGAVQFNCALIVLFRIVQIYRPAHAAIVTGALLTMGTASMLVSTMSLIATRNMKRLVAYASINHAGVIAIGLGVGKAAAYGLLLYVISNAFIKAILFLTVGRIKAHYRTKDTRQISGLLQHLPYSGVFLMVGTFALLGLPPFASFFGELLILSALVGANQLLVFAAFCILITMSFVATGRTIFPMIWGEPKDVHDWPRQTFVSAAPKIVFLLILVLLGIRVPSFVNDLMLRAVDVLGGP